MSNFREMIDFLSAYREIVMGYEKSALEALERKDTETYLAFMKKKAEKMSLILKEATPTLERIADETAKDNIYHQLKRFSNSANMGLRLNSPFYWSALLWADEAKPGDPDNLQLYIAKLERNETFHL